MFTFESFINNEAMGGAPGEGITVLNAEDLNGVHWDPGLNRPYRGEDGQVYVDVTVGQAVKKNAAGEPVTNALGLPVMQRVVRPQLVYDRMRRGLPVCNVNNATVLRKEQWIALDNTVLKAVRQRLRAWADLRAANTFGGFDGMATPILEYEVVTDVGEAIVDMDSISEGRNFQPSFALQGLPLPITHSDFWMSERFLAMSRTKGQPADTLRAEMAGRRVGEMIEKTLIGTETGITYGNPAISYLQTSKVYGYTNYPYRITKTDLVASASITPEGAFNAVLAMRELAYTNNFYGPFVLYVSTGYDAKLDVLFKMDTSNYPTIGTTRQAILGIDGITAIRRLDYLTGDVMILVQMTEDVVRAVNGLEVVTVQWDTKGGAQKNFKVMCIQVPQIRAAYKSGTSTLVTGIVHGTTS
jgi:hypothetical protein